MLYAGVRPDNHNLVAELGAFTFCRDGGGEEIQEVPFAYVPNLIKKATDLIEKQRVVST